MNAEKVWGTWNYLMLQTEIRSALRPDKMISATRLGLNRDMIAFAYDTTSEIIVQPWTSSIL